MKLTVLMYHYVFADSEKKYKNFFHLKTNSFQSQLKYIVNNYSVITPDEIELFANGELKTAKPPIVLTFDDGLKCHFTEVFPLLRKMKVPGYFFINTLPYLENSIPIIHKTHLLRAKMGDNEFATTCLEFTEELLGKIILDEVAPLHLAAKTYRWDTPHIKQVKYLLNMVLPDNDREQIIEELFKKIFVESEKNIIDEFFINYVEMREMQNNGMVLGGHSHFHKPLSRLDSRALQLDLKTCIRFLNSTLDSPVQTFSYPYGKQDTFNQEVVKRLKELGIKMSFSSEVGENSSPVDLFHIKRIDPKDFNYE